MAQPYERDDTGDPETVVMVNLTMLAAETARELVEQGFDSSQHAERWRLPAPDREEP